MLQRIHICAVICALAGLAALCSIALNLSFNLVFFCVCLVTITGYVLVALQQKQRRAMEQTGVAVGNFMRGALHARVQPLAADDEFSRLQHRINNLLDVVDLHLRGNDAAIDLSSHADYAEKLHLTGLAEALKTTATAPTADHAEAAPAITGVGSFLKELRHHAETIFTSGELTADAAAPPSEPVLHTQDILHVKQQLQHAAMRLQNATTQLAQRAMQPATAQDPARGSAAQLEASCTRMAEQATVISLNMAIEAGRAQATSPLHQATESLRGLTKQLHQLRSDLTQGTPTEIEAVPVATIPLSLAVEALTTAEQQLRTQMHALDALLERMEPMMHAEAA